MSGRNLTFRSALGAEGFEDEAVEMEVPEANCVQVGRQWLSQISP